jgi:protein phosphatase/serine/threonine-protein phosphatase Stp1
MPLKSWSATHRGSVRRHNEDALLDRAYAGLFAVADGLGGHDSGELASAMLCEALAGVPGRLPAPEAEARIRRAVADVHDALLAEARRRGPGVVIGSTIVVLSLHPDRFIGLWAGDSRLYRLDRGGLQRLSRDHSLVQQWVDAGTLRPEQAEHHPNANIITRAAGIADEPLLLDKVAGQVQLGDRFVLCSDGVFNALGEPDMAALLAGAEQSPAERLIAAALARGADDNITAVVVDA